MKILAIRGRNLASLGGDFEIDFRADPLASAGVFAITGPTGAGKSTLLDTLALALFHDTPRLRTASENGVWIPDADDAISPSDPRNILRRGCGEGFAEVDYIGIDKQRWQARWEVRRAQKKPDGRLQPARVTLTNLARDQVVGSGTRETRLEIEKTLGLSYEQFCRSVLLAQNEFAAFLRADGGQRAELLEALTGTEIYRVISRLCHQRNSEEAGKLDKLKGELNIEPPLSETDRSELETRLAEAEAALESAKSTHAAIQQEANWHEQGRKLGDRKTELERELKDQQQALDSRKDDLALVRRMEAVADARPLQRDLTLARTALATHEGQAETIQSALDKANKAVLAEQQRVKQTKEALEKAEGSQTQQAPNIRKARQLDQSIQALADQNSERTERQSKLAEQLEASQKQLELDQAAIEANEKEQSAWPEWLKDKPQLSGAVEDWSKAGRQLDKTVEARHKLDLAEDTFLNADKQAASARDRLGQFEKLALDSRDAVKIERQHRDQASKAEQQHDANALDQLQAALGNREKQLQQLRAGLDSERQVRDSLGKHREQHTGQQGKQSARQERLKALETAIPGGRARVEQAEKARQASRNIADRHTSALRRQLVEGDPCPVCGSREHPGHDQGDEEINRILDQLDAQLKSATKELKQLEEERTRLDVESRQASDQLEALQAEIEALKKQQSDSLAQLQQVTAAMELDIENIDALPQTLIELEEQLGRDAQDFQKRKKALAEARLAYQQAGERLRKAEQAQEKAEQALETERKQVKPLLEAEKSASSQLQLRTDELKEAIQTLQKLLELTEPLDDPEIAGLQTLWYAGESLREAAAQAKRQQPLLTRQLEERRNQGAALERQHRQLSEQIKKTAEELDSQRKARTATLSAADPDAFDRELQEATEQTRRVAEKSTNTLNAAQTTLTSAKAALKHWQEELKNRKGSVAQATQSLADWLSKHHKNAHLGLKADDSAGLLNLLETPDKQWQPLRDQLNVLQKDIEKLTARLQENTEQLEKWQAEQLSKRDIEAVTEALAKAGIELDQAGNQRAVLYGKLCTDDERRNRAAGQLKKIEAQQAISEQWAKLNDLIGSSDGSRFQRYAQQFTLDVLITYANAQLKTLAPRYRLQRGENNLNILVVDDDMGGEIRGVHSLSGGETFLASLALALGMAELSSQRVSLESLFIDEGFGSLDADTLAVAMDALDRLQAQGRKVGVISHVPEMSDRIGVQIRVERTSPGRSELQVTC